jgi:hypothetical protein
MLDFYSEWSSITRDNSCTDRCDPSHYFWLETTCDRGYICKIKQAQILTRILTVFDDVPVCPKKIWSRNVGPISRLTGRGSSTTSTEDPRKDPLTVFEFRYVEVYKMSREHSLRLKNDNWQEQNYTWHFRKAEIKVFVRWMTAVASACRMSFHILNSLLVSYKLETISCFRRLTPQTIITTIRIQFGWSAPDCQVPIPNSQKHWLAVVVFLTLC